MASTIITTITKRIASLVHAVADDVAEGVAGTTVTTIATRPMTMSQMTISSATIAANPAMMISKKLAGQPHGLAAVAMTVAMMAVATAEIVATATSPNLVVVGLGTIHGTTEIEKRPITVRFPLGTTPLPALSMATSKAIPVAAAVVAVVEADAVDGAVRAGVPATSVPATDVLVTSVLVTVTLTAAVPRAEVRLTVGVPDGDRPAAILIGAEAVAGEAVAQEINGLSTVVT